MKRGILFIQFICCPFVSIKLYRANCELSMSFHILHFHTPYYFLRLGTSHFNREEVVAVRARYFYHIEYCPRILRVLKFMMNTTPLPACYAGIPTEQIFQFISRKLSGTLTGALEAVQVNLDILLPTYSNLL